MTLGFSFEETMRLSNIKRWGIVEMSRPQSVAEHSYNVAMISTMVMNRLSRGGRGITHTLRLAVVEWALVHDLPELVTGDIPTPIKSMIKGPLATAERALFHTMALHEEALPPLALAICKAADLIDAIQFATKFCVDSRRREIINGLKCELNRAGERLNSDRDKIALREVIRSICREEKTL